MLGGSAYDLLVLLNRWFNHGRRLLGFPYWSMSAYLKPASGAIEYSRIAPHEGRYIAGIHPA